MGEGKWPELGEIILVQDRPTTEAQRELWANHQPPTKRGEVVEVPKEDGSGFLVIDAGGEYGGINYPARDFDVRYTWKYSSALSLASIDSMRNMAVSGEIVAAVAFAARAAHSNRTIHRFVSALVMTNALKSESRWGGVLKMVMDLEKDEG